jgi:hypothetical protein
MRIRRGAAHPGVGGGARVGTRERLVRAGTHTRYSATYQPQVRCRQSLKGCGSEQGEEGACQRAWASRPRHAYS